jgi:hypothetical protein
LKVKHTFLVDQPHHWSAAGSGDYVLAALGADPASEMTINYYDIE